MTARAMGERACRPSTAHCRRRTLCRANCSETATTRSQERALNERKTPLRQRVFTSSNHSSSSSGSPSITGRPTWPMSWRASARRSLTYEDHIEISQYHNITILSIYLSVLVGDNTIIYLIIFCRQLLTNYKNLL